VPALVDRVDAYQRGHRWVGMPLGVVYKFFDDQGGYLAAVMTYYAFLAIFPILLIASSVLGFVLQGHPQLQQDILSSALAQFPIVGDQLGRPEGLQGSTSAVVVGALAALYGVIGLGQAAQNAVNVAWAIPRNSRLNPVVSRLRGLVWLVLAGLALLLVAVVSSLGGNLEVVGLDVGGAGWLVVAATVVLTSAVLAVMLQLSTPRKERFVELLPGAVLIAVLWQLLQVVGGVYVEHVITRASQMNAVFAVVLGLMALLYVGTVIAIIGLELDVVLAKRLYPRALLTPFTDAVELTRADRRVYREYAEAQRHKGFERIHVTFDNEPDK
jgi:membrane protein